MQRLKTAIKHQKQAVNVYRTENTNWLLADFTVQDRRLYILMYTKEGCYPLVRTNIRARAANKNLSHPHLVVDLTKRS